MKNESTRQQLVETEDIENSSNIISQLENQNGQNRESISSEATKMSIDSIALNRIPRRLKKTFYCSLSLFLLGIILLILGIEEAIRRNKFDAGMTYIIIGVIVSIPGCYYTYQFYKAHRVDDIEDRKEIYGDIPEL
jgi:hypothetical protein